MGGKRRCPYPAMPQDGARPPQVRRLAASTGLGHNLGQWRAGVDGKGAEEARHQICRAVFPVKSRLMEAAGPGAATNEALVVAAVCTS